MIVYLIKRKGGLIWQNIYFDREINFSDGSKIYVGVVFFSEEDAKAYLETLNIKELYEVVSATVDK